MNNATTENCITNLINGFNIEKLSDEETNDLLIESVHTQQLRIVVDSLLKTHKKKLSSVSLLKIESAQRVCQAISDYAENESKHLQVLLLNNGINVEYLSQETDRGSLQHHSIKFKIDSSLIEPIISIIESLGYRCTLNWRGAAWLSYKSTRSSVTFIKTDSVTTRLILIWDNAPSKQTTLNRLKPTDADFSAISLPSPLWRLYPLVRVIRGFSNRILSKKDPLPEWPFLGTPIELITPLFQIAKIDQNDYILDIGCGDGRIIVEAAKQFGCRSVGIEKDTSLIELAQKSIIGNSLQSRAKLIQSDNLEHDFEGITIVFLFLPIRSIPTIISELKPKLKKGTRIIVHEQERPKFTLTPDHSIPLFSKSAITIAHIWTI